jgi:hypothetical protein
MSQARPILPRIRAKKPQRSFRKSSTIAALYSRNPSVRWLMVSRDYRTSGYQYQHPTRPEVNWPTPFLRTTSKGSTKWNVFWRNGGFADPS